MAEQLTEEQIAEYKEVFSFFDKDGDNAITTAELADVIRGLGYNPSEKELDEVIKNIDPEQQGMVDFPEFLSLMAKKPSPFQLDKEDEVIQAFKFFDKTATEKDSVPTIDCELLKHAMVTYGEKMSEEEVLQMISVADPKGEGKINYEQFTKLLLSK